MTLGELCRRVMQKVDDVNGDLYSPTEFSDAINLAKDEVLSLTRIYTDQYPQSSTTATFGVGDKEYKLPDDCLDVLKIEYYDVSGSVPQKRAIIDFMDQESRENSAFYIRRTNRTTIYLGRKYTQNAISVIVYYRPTVNDTASITTATTATYSFGPDPSDNLIIVKAANYLRGSRDRKLLMDEEQRWERIYVENMSRFNRSPRRVRYVREA